MISAVIFDLDGTVLDNEPAWEEAFAYVADKYEIPRPTFKVGATNWYHEPGLGLMPNWRKYFPLNPEKAEKLAKETWQEYWKEEKTMDNIQVRSGVDDLVAKAKELGWQTALSTGSAWVVVETELEQLKLFLDFDVTTTGEEVLLEKPDPEIYLLTAQKLGVEPEDCLVIEDAVAGVRAGVEAGMEVAAIESDYAPAEELKAAGAKWVFEDLKELSSSGVPGLWS